MLTPYLPYPPSEGGQVRSYNLIKLLSLHHDITLVSFTREHNTQNHVEHMHRYCKKVIVFKRGKTWTMKNVLKTGLSLYPFLVTIYNSPKIKSILDKEIKTGNYDLVHGETFYVMPFLPKNDLPTVLVEQTIMSSIFSHHVKTESRLWMRPFEWLDVQKIKFWEKYYWKKADRVVAVSEEDAGIMKSMVPGLRVDVVPNGVGEDFNNLSKKIHFNHTILYMANYKWIQNWEAVELLAKAVFPPVKEEIVDAKLLIAGQFPTPQVKKLAEKDIKVRELKDDDFKGVVDSYLKSGLMVAPMYARGGSRLKILAAMASMVPVVTTPVGAEGYGAVDGESILIGKTNEDLAKRAVEVLTDRNLYDRVAKNARKLVDERFSWEPIAKKLESIYEEIINSNS